MKKNYLLLFAVAIMFASCSKEAKLNKRIDGEWNVTMYDGVALPSGETEVIKFDRDKKGEGTYIWTYTDASGTEVETGTYDLTKDEKIAFVSKTYSMTYEMEIEEYTKTKLKLKYDGAYFKSLEATKK